MTSERVKNTGRNILFAFIFQFVKIFLVFINRIIFVKILGASYLGVNGLFSNILGILSLADLGMTTVLMYALYEPLAKNDTVKIQKYINYFKRVYNIIALAIAIIGILFIPFLQYLVNLPSNLPNIYIYYILLLSNTVISYLFVYKTTLVSADQKMYILNKYDTIFQFVLFVLQILMLILTKSFILYLLSNVVCTLFCNIVKVKKTEKIYPYLKEKNSSSLNKKEKANIFKNIKSLFLYKIGGVILSNTDNILISVIVGTITVGYYSNYATIIISIETFLTMIFSSIKASVGNYIVTEEKNSQIKIFNILEVYNFWIVSFCTICFIILIPDFIEICFGKDYVLSLGVLICITLNFYTSNIRQTLWAFRETTGIFDRTKYITLTTAVLNLVLSIILGKKFGLIGILSATVLSRMIYSWWKEPKIIFNEHFKASVSSYYINYIKRAILGGFICLAIYMIGNIMPISNIYIKFIIKCTLCVSIPTIIYYLIYKKSEAYTYLKENVLKKLKRG